MTTFVSRMDLEAGGMFGWLRFRKRHRVAATQIVVVDASTIMVDGRRVRLAGFATPSASLARSELEQWLASAAADRLRALTAPPNRVNLEEISGHESQGPAVARLFINGQDVAEIAIAEGWGVPSAG